MKDIMFKTIVFGLGMCFCLMMTACGEDSEDSQEGTSPDNQGKEVVTPSSGESGASVQESSEQSDPDKPRPGAADGEHGFTELTWPQDDEYYCGGREMKGFEGNLDKYCVATYGANYIGYCYKEGEEEVKVCYPGCSSKGKVMDECEFRHTENLGDVYLHTVTQCIVKDNHLVEEIVDMRKCVHECNAAGTACD